MRDIMKNQNLLNDIGFAEIVEAKRDDFETFITELKTSIINKIGEQKLKAPLSDEKIALFYDSTNRIISEAFNSYREIFNPLSYIDTNNEIKFSITGGKTILSKSAFTDKDIPTLYYESVFADQIANSNIKRIIPNSFSISRTKRYLLNRDNLLLGVEKAIGNNKDVAIVAINIGIDIKDILINSKFSKNTVMIPSTEYRTHDVLFILKKDDLPVIEHVDLRDEEKKELQFTNPINNEIKLYASVIDINLEKNKDIKDKWNWENKEGNLDLKVQLSIAFIGVIHWKKNRDIIQINIASQYKEQGIQNDINDIEPLTV